MASEIMVGKKTTWSLLLELWNTGCNEKQLNEVSIRRSSHNERTLYYARSDNIKTKQKKKEEKKTKHHYHLHSICLFLLRPMHICVWHFRLLTQMINASVSANICVVLIKQYQ